MADLPIERENVDVNSTMKAELPKPTNPNEQKNPASVQVTQGNVELVMVKLLEECRDLLRVLVNLANLPD